MIQVDTKAGLGNIGVATTDFKGHSPEFWAEYVVYQKTQHPIYDNKLKRID